MIFLNIIIANLAIIAVYAIYSKLGLTTELAVVGAIVSVAVSALICRK